MQCLHKMQHDVYRLPIAPWGHHAVGSHSRAGAYRQQYHARVNSGSPAPVLPHEPAPLGLAHEMTIRKTPLLSATDSADPPVHMSRNDLGADWLHIVSVPHGEPSISLAQEHNARLLLRDERQQAVHMERAHKRALAK